MNAKLNTVAAVAALLVATMSQAHAELILPEPGSLALSALGLAAAVYFLRNSRKK
jgi:hypothetical protein